MGKGGRFGFEVQVNQNGHRVVKSAFARCGDISHYNTAYSVSVQSNGLLLASVLSGAPEALLDRYEAERRPIALNMLRLSTRLLGEVKQGTMQRDREARQLDLGHRGSSLNVPGSVSGKVQAGDRALEALCRGQAGQRTRLFTVFQGPHWTLLGYEVRDRPSAIAGVWIVIIGPGYELVDEEGDIAEAYGVEPGQWVLVRPDGYITGIFPSDELEAQLSRYFAHVLPSPPNVKFRGS